MDPSEKILKSSSGKLVSTYWPQAKSMPKDLAVHRTHNKIIDEHYEYALIEDADLESLLDKSFVERDLILELNEKITLPIVRAHLLRFAFLYRYGGWFFDSDIYQTLSLDGFQEHDNIIFVHDSDKRVSMVLMKFIAKHPAIEATLKAIALNYQNQVHLHDVHWFSGNFLFGAICSREYEFSITRLPYNKYVNYAGCAFATSEHARVVDWRILQHFGLIEGVEPDFTNMPKRISYDEADLIVSHIRKYGLEDYAKRLKAQRPVYFEENHILRTLL